MTKSGQRIVPKSNNRLAGITAFKCYEVISGTGEVNLSPAALKTGHMVHCDSTCNIVDDEGKIRFVSLEYFQPFNHEMGLFR